MKRIRSNDLTEDTQWVSLRSDVVATLFRFFDTDINVRTAYTIRMDALLAGSILFQRKKDRSQGGDDDEKQWWNMVYSQWCREVVRSMWSVGFAAASYVVDETYGPKPVVLNLEEVEIDFYNNAFNQPEWAYFEKNQGTLAITDRKPIKNVVTFYTPDCLPARDGAFRSYMTSLLRDMSYEDHLMQCDMMATTSRCNPPIVSENLPDKFDPNDITSALAAGSKHGDGQRHLMGAPPPGAAAPSYPTMEIVGTAGDAYFGAQRQHQVRDTISMLNAHNTGDLGAIQKEMQRDFRRKFQGQAVPQFYLDNGRHFVKQTLAEGPEELVLKAQLQRTERVLTLLGVPMSMITQSASMNGKRAINENSMMLFNNSQRMLKQQLISYMQRMYSFIYRRQHAMEALKQSDEDEDAEVLKKRMQEEAYITISMPGLPSDADLDRYWMTGVLKYGVYCDYVAAKHGIARNSFHEKQQLTPEDLNGIKEDEAALS